MTELRRWSEEGATAAELSLLEISRRERVPAQARTRALQGLGLVAVASSVAGAAAAAAATGRSAGVLLKLLSIPVLSAGLLAGGLAIERAHRARTPATSASAAALVARPSSLAAAHASTPPSVDSVEAPAGATATSATSATATSAASPAVPALSARVARSEGSAGRLSREVQALELAQQALGAHNAGSALRLLDRYGAEFPAGALGSEATVLRVRALLMNGNRGAAQTLANSYALAHPDSPYARRIQDILRSGR